jgi:predicted HAD superfamily Cof-like phosphohydrolase
VRVRKVALPVRLPHRSFSKAEGDRMIRKQVGEFHAAFDQPTLDRPQVPSDERVKLRVRLVGEEFCEMLDAIYGKDCVDAVRGAIAALVRDGVVAVDLVELVDALADLDYVVEGTRQEFGVDGEPVAAEVHRSNMAKVGGVKRPDGKILKPAGWTPPDIEGELLKQGWRP